MFKNKKIIIVLIVIGTVALLGIIYFLVFNSTKAWFIGEGREFNCSIGEESYNIEIWSYDDNHYTNIEGYKSYWLCPDCNLEQLTDIKEFINYDDLNETQMFITAYFKSLGGSCN